MSFEVQGDADASMMDTSSLLDAEGAAADNSADLDGGGFPDDDGGQDEPGPAEYTAPPPRRSAQLAEQYCSYHVETVLHDDDSSLGSTSFTRDVDNLNSFPI